MLAENGNAGSVIEFRTFRRVQTLLRQPGRKKVEASCAVSSEAGPCGRDMSQVEATR